MDDKKIITVELFDPDFFEEGEAYIIRAENRFYGYNHLLSTKTNSMLTFIDSDGNKINITIDEYKTKYDIKRLVMQDEASSKDCSDKPEQSDGQHVSLCDILNDEYDIHIVRRYINYDTGSTLIEGDISKLDVYNALDIKTEHGIQIKPFWYRVDVIKTENGIACLKNQNKPNTEVHAAIYSISDKPLKGFKLHPLFNDSKKVFINDSFTNIYSGYNKNLSYDSYTNEIAEKDPSNTMRMISIEMISAIQLLGIVQYGIKGIGSMFNDDHPVLYDLLKNIDTYVEGITINNGYVKIRNNKVAFYHKDMRGYIKYFMYFPYYSKYDWLFIPAKTIRDVPSYTTGTFARIFPSGNEHVVNMKIISYSVEPTIYSDHVSEQSSWNIDAMLMTVINDEEEK